MTTLSSQFRKRDRVIDPFRIDEALVIQQPIELEAEAAQQPMDYIFEELQLLHRAKGQLDRAEHYARRVKALGQ